MTRTASHLIVTAKSTRTEPERYRPHGTHDRFSVLSMERIERLVEQGGFREALRVLRRERETT